METSVLDWLASVGATAFRWSAIGFVLVNGAAIAAVVLTKDRTLVNRWTGRVLAANLVLAGTGIGIPLVTAASRFAISVVTPAKSSMLPAIDTEERPEGRALERSK
jgi:hypothetical protein